jgi:hypothetical protein
LSRCWMLHWPPLQPSSLLRSPLSWPSWLVSASSLWLCASVVVFQGHDFVDYICRAPHGHSPASGHLGSQEEMHQEGTCQGSQASASIAPSPCGRGAFPHLRGH